MFNAEIKEENNTLKICLQGDLDVYSEDEFKDFLDQNLKKVEKDLIFDLSDLDYLDSTGLGMFMNIYKMASENEKSVKIINAKENIYKLFKITDLTDIFKMEK